MPLQGFGMGIVRWNLLWYDTLKCRRKVSSFLLETINGLGMHLLAVTPTQLVAMTKVGLCTASLLSRGFFDTHFQAGSAFHRTNIPNCRLA